MAFTKRLARATACATLLAIPAAGVAAESTIRVEGTRSTVLPETAYVLPDAGTSLTIRDTVDGDVMSVGGRTAAAQLGNASRLYGMGFAFNDDPSWGFGLIAIGGDPSDWSDGPAWFVKRNHRLADVGAGSLLLEDGDEVLWALSPFDANWEMALDELSITAPSAPMVTGQPFQVRVSSYDNSGNRTAAAGATVAYRGSTATTGADGTLALTATGTGPADVVATRAGAVRDAARVCAHPVDDPAACDLPPLPKATMPAAGEGITGGTGGATMTVPVTIRVGGAEVTLTAEVPVPEAGGRPVVIRRQMISGPDLSPPEMRAALGAVASALAARLNQRAQRGDSDLALPPRVTWQASWLSGSPYVVPLRRDEALLGAVSGGPRNTRAMADRVGDLNRHLTRCGLAGTATRIRRHGYALAVLSPAPMRGALVECVEDPS